MSQITRFMQTHANNGKANFVGIKYELAKSFDNWMIILNFNRYLNLYVDFFQTGCSIVVEVLYEWNNFPIECKLYLITGNCDELRRKKRDLFIFQNQNFCQVVSPMHHYDDKGLNERNFKDHHLNSPLSPYSLAITRTLNRTLGRTRRYINLVV